MVVEMRRWNSDVFLMDVILLKILQFVAGEK